MEVRCFWGGGVGRAISRLFFCGCPQRSCAAVFCRGSTKLLLMICRNAKNCVRMTGLVVGYDIRCCADRSRQRRRVPGRCGLQGGKRQEHRGQAFVRKESGIFLVRAGASPGGGPQACPAGSAPKILANPAFGRHWLRSGETTAESGIRLGAGSAREFFRTLARSKNLCAPSPRPLYSKSDGRNPCCPICRILGAYSAKSARGSWSMLLICTISIPFGRFPLAR